MDLRGSVRICEHIGLSAVRRNGQTTNQRSQNYRFHNNAHGHVGEAVWQGRPQLQTWNKWGGHF